MLSVLPTILLIDNNNLAQHFEGLEVGVVCCESGELALEFLSDRSVDFICISPDIPEGNGVELVRRIRALPGCHQLPVVLITSDVSTELQADAFRAGVTELFLAQDIEQLVNYFMRLIRQVRPVNAHILYVEDSAIQARLMLAQLTYHGITADWYHNAEQALDALKQKPYDLVLTDIKLGAGMDGTQFARCIRRLEGTPGDIPILAITANDDAAQRIKLFRIGINDYVIKPVVDEELIVRIRCLIERQQMIVEVKEHEKELELQVAQRTEQYRLVHTQMLQSKKSMQSLLDSMYEGAYGVDMEGTCTFVNQAFLNILGYQRFEEVLGKDIHALIHHSYADGTPYPASECKILLALQTRQPIEVSDEVFWTKKGIAIPVEYRANPINKDGNLVGLVTTFVDVTQRREVEQELKRHRLHLEELVQQQTGKLLESEQLWKFAIEGSGEGVWDWDIQTNEAKYSTRWKAMLGYAEEDIGHTKQVWDQLIHPDDRSYIAKAMRAYLAGKTDVYVVEYRLRCKDGSYLWVLGRGMVVSCSADGKPLRMIGTHSDITERKQAEEAILAANRSKTEFLANMSHEIRTPMNGVVGMLDVLRQTELSPSQQQMLNTIQESSLALLNILNDILDLSRLEAGKLEIERIPTYLREVIESVALLLFPAANVKSINLFAFVSPLLPRWIASDPTRLRQVLLNLLGNAIKFTPERDDRHGKVVLRVEPATLSDGRPGLQLRVIDNGIGMSPETQAKLFRPFSQGDESTSRKFGGAGLGLSITQRLVERMGGWIMVRSTLGEGSEFIVELPLEEAAPGWQLAPEPDLTGVRVLAVTGNEVCAETLTAYCGAAGAGITVVASLASALAQLQQAQPLLDKAVLLLGPDIVIENESRLPDTVRVIRLMLRGQNDSSGTAVLVHTGPLLYRELIHGLAIASERLTVINSAEQIGLHPLSRDSATTADKALVANRLILLAEDNETNREVMQEQLSLLGYTAEMAGDGVVALNMWRTGRYDLLLTDCYMPNMDGFELARTIRNEEPPGIHMPIIAVTASMLQGEPERCLEHGMDGFLAKPLRLDELGAMLEKWLPLTVEKAAAENARADSGGEPDGASDTTELPVWDAFALTRMIGDNPAMQRRLLEKFLINAQGQVATIISAVAAMDAATAGSVAHALKSAARTVGAMQFGELCQAMEMSGKAGDQAACLALTGRLETAFEGARAIIGDYLAEHSLHS